MFDILNFRTGTSVARLLRAGSSPARLLHEAGSPRSAQLVSELVGIWDCMPFRSARAVRGDPTTDISHETTCLEIRAAWLAKDYYPYCINLSRWPHIQREIGPVPGLAAASLES